MQIKQTSSSHVFKSVRPPSRIQIKPEVQLNPNYKSLTFIPQVSRVPENQFQIRQIDHIGEHRRSNYHTVIAEKKYSILQPSKSEHHPGLIEKVDELGQSNTERRKPKSILKQKSPRSSNHSDVLTFFEMVEDPRLLPKRNKFASLKPLQSPRCSRVSPRPSVTDSGTPKRVSFSHKVTVQLIDSYENNQQSKRYALADLVDNI